MRNMDLAPEDLIEIGDDDIVATITGGVSPWMSTMRLAANLGADRLGDANTLVNQQPRSTPW